jgi:CRISPR-associated protein Csd1
MSWVAKLYETYENALKLNLPDGDKLVPVSHTLQNAHINIVIDGEGNFRRAKVLLKEKIMLPATEQSAGRTSGDAPHPLADKLQYVAKDYIQFGGAKKSYFDSYEAQLFRWCESSHSHPKIRAVYKYIKKGCVIEDLIRAKIIFIDENNKLLSEWNREVVEGESTPSIFKILPKSKGKIEQGDALVCWTVEVDRDMQSSSNTWEDTGLQESWILFDASSGGVEGLCFVSGERVLLATNHPAKLCNTGDKAKLISSNDKNGYTYRGRFINDAQACGMSFSVTQKAHSALRWLISRQGYRNANQVVVAWAVSGVSIPSPLQSSEWFNGIDELDEIVEVDKEESTAIDYGSNLGQQFADYRYGA